MKTLLYKVCLFVIFVICYVDVQAQSDSLKINSLKKVLLTEKEDTNKVNTLNQMSGMLAHDKNSAIAYANQALVLSQKLNYSIGEGNAFYTLGDIETGNNYINKKRDINKALEYFNKAIKIFKASGNQLKVADTYSEIADAYRGLNSNFSEAANYFFAALKIYEKLGAKDKLANRYIGLGSDYIRFGDFNKGLSKLKFSLSTYEQMNDSPDIASVCIIIGQSYLQNKKLNDALYYFDKAFSIYTTLGKNSPEYGIPWAKGNIADVYISQAENAFLASDNHQLALKKIQLALPLCMQRLELESAGNMSHSQTYLQIGNCYYDLSYMLPKTSKESNLLESKKYYELSLKLGKETNGKELTRDSYNKLSIVFHAMGNYKEAYENYTNYISNRDSILSADVTKKIAQLQMQYDFDKKDAAAKAAQEKKDADAKHIKNQQYLVITALGVIVLAAIIIVLTQFRNNKLKQQANIALQNQKNKVESTLAELKSTQAQLIQSEKMASLGELTAGIAHEIQNPLNFVNNFSEVNKEMLEELKAERLKPNAERDEDLQTDLINDVIANEEKINHHGKRADAIVKGMLQHSRQTSGMKEATDINALCDEYLRLSYHGLRAKDKSFNADFKTDFDESIGKINIVPQDIGRVLLNLFNNAFYATNSEQKTADESYKPLVTIQTKKLTDKIEITVSDNGNGIPQNIIDKIFQPFFTTKPTGEGTGLGLSLVYDIITKEHNGTIKVESTEGEGTTFVINLSIS